MTLSDGMGYDGTPERARVSRPAILGLALVVLLVGAIVGVLVNTGRAPAPASGSEVPASAPAPTSTPTAGATPSVTDEHDHGHDSGTGTGAPVEVWGVLEAFLAAWCSTDPETRAQGFEATATADLARGLSATDVSNVVTAPRTGVEVIGSSSYVVEFQVMFEGQPTPVQVIVVADPGGSAAGWRVARVEQKEG